MKIDFCKDESCSFHMIDEDNVIYIDNDIAIIHPLNPTNDGHVLFIPIKHEKYFHNYFPYEIKDIFTYIKGYILKELPGEDYDIVIQTGKSAGQTIPHLHWHLVPRKPNDKGFNIEWNKE